MNGKGAFDVYYQQKGFICNSYLIRQGQTYEVVISFKN